MNIRFIRAGVCACLIVLTAATMSFRISAAPLPSWPKTDVAADPDVLFGELPNGMRYALMHNATPTGEVSIRLRLAVGSLQETQTQRGLAHFVEHMAFRGTTHFADGQIQKALEQLGVKFYVDANAFTAQSQTTYQFDLPKADDRTVDTGLAIARDIVSEITFDPDAIKTERGVIHSELSFRDTPASRVSAASAAFGYKDPHASAVLPGGDPAVVANADALSLYQFYRTYYRPERATLIVVGDIDLAKMQAAIKARFSDWKGTGDVTPDPVLTIPGNRTLEANNFVDPSAPSTTALMWIKPHGFLADTQAREKQEHIELIGFLILNRHLAQAAAGADHPFASAVAAHQEFLRYATISALTATNDPGRWHDALQSLEKVRQHMLQNGVTQEEVDGAVAQLHALMQARAAGANTRPSPDIATSILRSVDDGDVYTSPQEDLAQINRELNGLTAQDVTSAFRNVFVGSSGPLVFVSGPKAIGGGEPAIKYAYTEASNTSTQTGVTTSATASSPTQSATASAAWPYTDFGTPGTVATTRKVDDLDVTYVQFSNGVRLAVKPTKLRADQILVSVKIGGGRLDLPTDHKSAAWTGNALIIGGLEAMDFQTMQQVLASKTYKLIYFLGDDAFVLAGETRAADLDTQLQVLAAYTKAAGFRATGFEQVRGALLAQIPQIDSTPQLILQLRAPQAMHAGDPRWAFPTLDDIRNAKVEDLKELLQPEFEKGAIDITIVGDITTDQAIKAVAATFGALPPRAVRSSAMAPANTTKFPAGNQTPLILSSNGQASQDIATVAWPVPGRFSNIATSAGLAILGDIIQTRLIKTLRGEGLTYVALAGTSSSKVFDYGYVQAVSQLPPDKTLVFYDAIANIVTDLQTNGPTDEELEVARGPMLQDFAKLTQTNEYWNSVLDGTQETPEKLDLVRSWKSDLQNVTVTDIQALARKYLNPNSAWKMQIVNP